MTGRRVPGSGRASRRRERGGTDKPPAETRSDLGLGFTYPPVNLPPPTAILTGDVSRGYPGTPVVDPGRARRRKQKIYQERERKAPCCLGRMQHYTHMHPHGYMCHTCCDFPGSHSAKRQTGTSPLPEHVTDPVHNPFEQGPTR
jgi:hypothetical protein